MHITNHVKKDTYILNIGRNFILLDRALEVIRAFQKENIDFLFLKGFALAYTIYPDVGFRPMADIDFLIKRENLHRIDETLTQLGYVEISPRAQRAYGCDITFCDKDNVMIDIHWDLCKYERFKGIIEITKDFWNRAGEFKLEGITICTLSMEDHILYVSLHYAMFHTFLRKNGVYDLFYFIDGHQVNWQVLIDNAYKYGLRIPLYYSLLQVARVTGLKLPDFVWDCLRPSPLKKAWLDYMLFRYNASSLRYLSQALMLDNLWDTLRVLYRTLKAIPRSYNRNNPITFKNIPAAIKI